LLKEYRKAAQLTQEDLAVKTQLIDRAGRGISIRTIQDLERGARGKGGGIQTRTLRLLTKALGLADADIAIFAAAARQPDPPSDEEQQLLKGLETAEKLASEMRDRDVVLRAADTALSIAHTIGRLGRTAECEMSFRRNLALREEHHDLHGKAEVSFLLGKLMLLCERYSEGEALLNESLRIRRLVPVQDADNHAEPYSVLGRVARCREPMRILEDYYTGALKLAQSRQNKIWQWGIYLTLGSIAWICQDHPTAERNYLEALKLADELLYIDNWGRVSSLLGSVKLEQGQLNEAEAYFRQSMSILGKIQDPRNSSPTLYEWGRVDEAQGDISSARTKYYKAYALSNEINDLRSKGCVLLCLAHMVERDDATKSEDYYRKGLRLLETVRHYPNIAKGKLAFGQFLLAQGERKYGMTCIAAAHAWFKAMEINRGNCGHNKAAMP
jgi:tetratricopeptide (TPR) repeat protein